MAVVWVSSYLASEWAQTGRAALALPFLCAAGQTAASYSLIPLVMTKVNGFVRWKFIAPSNSLLNLWHPFCSTVQSTYKAITFALWKLAAEGGWPYIQALSELGPPNYMPYNRDCLTSRGLNLLMFPKGGTRQGTWTCRTCYPSCLTVSEA